MSKPTTINSSSSKYSPISISAKNSHNLNGTDLKFELELRFYPFDLRQYSWNLYQVSSSKNNDSTILYTDNEKYNWIKSTIYNYIPFGLYMAEENGRFNSFSSATFIPINTLWNINGMSHTYDYGDNVSTTDIIEMSFKQKAKMILSPRDEFYKTLFGQSFDFEYAINGNKFFSLKKPSSSNNFDDLLNSINNGDENNVRTYTIWKDNKSEKSSQNVIKLSANVKADLSIIKTYAIVIVNPFSREIQKEFITIEKKTQPTSKTVYVYVDKSLRIDGDKSKLNANCSSANNKVNITLSKKNDGDIDWQTLNPRITFRIKKITV